MHTVDVAQRRARLGTRHALAPSAAADDAVGAARAVAALHGTDPATTVLSAVLRTRASTVADVDAALHVDRSLVRVLAMRRTVFAVPRDLAGTVLAAAGDGVAREQRRLLAKMLVASGVTDDPEPWIARAADVAVEAVRAGGEVLSTELAAADPLLGTRVEVAPGTRNATTASVASRLLTMLSAEGRVVRARPRGTWASTQFRWADFEAWVGPVERPGPEEASARLARLWLHAHGPATADDLQWWTGWTKTRTRQAVAALDVVEVDLDGTPGLLLADDLEPVPEPEPWVALLPALDPTAMGWRHRAFCQGDHRPLLFDVNGNAGPTVWADGRMVGGWAQRDDGEVVVRLLEDVGRETAAAVEARAEHVRAVLGDARLKARARGWTPVERELRA